eukprot:TRINITY_DN16944_c0_g1_i1.p1 TRINITY_DN16944_c0_g1~~TRINITY_DN16944_c0_g1_i1.p1  ORF type:complete len:165 (+),score=26.31 TRINITY_DN16944_c0_g1_i1:351-845(+)
MRFIPPPNFGYVEEDLYRSGHPNVLNFPFLERLKIRKIIYLAPDDPSDDFLNFIDDQGIELYHLGVDGSYGNPWSTITEDVVIQAMNLMLNPDNYPMYVCCNLGRHRTGTIIGCLRKLQRWNLTSIFEEYRRHSGPKVRLLNEQFIELFDTELVAIPQNSPKWL